MESVSSPEESDSSLELTTSPGDKVGLLRLFGILEIVMRSVCRVRWAVDGKANT